MTAFVPAIRRTHEALSEPTLHNGRPTFTATNVVGPVWADYLRIGIDGRDVTFWRGIPTLLHGWQHADPYGWASASLFFPQITELDDVDGDPALSWLRLGASARVDRVLDHARVNDDDPPFVGYVTTLEPSSEGLAVGLTGLAPTRLSAQLHQPAVDFRAASDGGRRLYTLFASATLELLPRLGPTTGIMIPSNGSRDMTRLGFSDLILGLLIGTDGSSWTVMPELSSGPRAFRMRKRSMSSVDATVYAGAHGVKVSGLGRDLFDSPTHIFGEGVSTTGERWRNAVYPDLGPLVVPPYPFTNGRTFGPGTSDADTDTGDGITVLSKEFAMQGLMPYGTNSAPTYDDDMVDAAQETQDRLGLAQTGRISPSLWQAVYRAGFAEKSFAGAHFAPLARDSRVDKYLTTADGTVVGINPQYDYSILPVHQFVSYGEQVTKRQARANARAVRARGGDRNGSLTLTSDPAEMSRFDLKGGMTIRVRNLAGTGSAGLKLYVSSAEVDWQGGSVTLAVSSSPKHYLELSAIRDRNAAAKSDPAKRWRTAQRASQQVQDGMTGWEGESGAGIIIPTSLQGGRWSVIAVVAARVGTIGELHLDSGSTPFMCAMFADEISGAALDGRLGNPFERIISGDPGPTAIPGDGYALSGNGEAADWLSSNADVGDTVTLLSSPSRVKIGDSIHALDGTNVARGTDDLIRYTGSSTPTNAFGIEVVVAGSPDKVTRISDRSQGLDFENVFEHNASWLTHDALMIEAWGEPGQPCGYWPHAHTNSAGKVTRWPCTGAFRDDATWEFATRQGFLWLAVYPARDCRISGRARVAISDGG